MEEEFCAYKWVLYITFERVRLNIWMNLQPCVDAAIFWATRVPNKEQHICICDVTDSSSWMSPIICVPWLVRMDEWLNCLSMTHSAVWAWLIYLCDILYSSVWHDFKGWRRPIGYLISCRSFPSKELLIIELSCRKWPGARRRGAPRRSCRAPSGQVRRREEKNGGFIRGLSILEGFYLYERGFVYTRGGQGSLCSSLHFLCRPEYQSKNKQKIATLLLWYTLQHTLQHTL